MGAPQRYPGFVNGSFASRSGRASVERTMNWYVSSLSSPSASNRVWLEPAPGYTLFADLVTVGNRALFEQNGRAFAINGGKFIEIFADGSFHVWGDVATDQYPALICGNGDAGNQLLASSGDNGYLFDLITNVFSTVRTGGTRMVDMLDGFFLALDDSDSTLYASNLLDGTTWDPTMRFQRSLATDRWVTLRVVGNLIYLIGKKTGDILYNDQGAPFPFARHPSGDLKAGIAAPWSACDVNGVLTWVSATKDGQGDVVTASGTNLRTISPPELHATFDRYVDLGNALSATYEDDGHRFYVMSAEADKGTWAYDATTGLWCERGTWISEENQYHAQRTMFHTFAFGTHLVGDRTTGKIYRMDSALYRDVDDRPLRRFRRAPVLMASALKRVYFGAFSVLAQTGVGLPDPTAQGHDPVLELRVSNDFGSTFFSRGFRSLGKQGEGGRLVEWNQMGAGRGRCAEIVATDPVPMQIIDAYQEMA